MSALNSCKLMHGSMSRVARSGMNLLIYLVWFSARSQQVSRFKDAPVAVATDLALDIVPSATVYSL